MKVNTADEFYRGRLTPMRMRSADLCLRHQLGGATFDAIYIDGDHTAEGVLTDLAMAWPLLKVGGVLIFDDFAHPDYADMAHAITWWLGLESARLELVDRGWQLTVRRTAAGAEPIPICPMHDTAHLPHIMCGR